jgi:hypothetical protein
VRLVFCIGLGLIVLGGFRHLKAALTGLGQIIGRCWSFYRRGQSGLEGTILGNAPGNSTGRLLEAKKFFVLESRVISTPMRPTVLHCPMCRTILVGLSTDQLRCPKCESPIRHLRLAMDAEQIERGLMMATGPTQEWLPWHVGEFLKRRYGNVWQ